MSSLIIVPNSCSLNEIDGARITEKGLHLCASQTHHPIPCLNPSRIVKAKSPVEAKAD